LLIDDLSVWLKDYRRLAILGIGNPLRSDDAVGLELLKHLKGKVPKNVRLLRCEMTPENFLNELERFKPTHVLMIDAGQLQAKPGEARIISPEKIASTLLSTHTLPITILGGILEKDLKAKVMFLAIQPESIEIGEGLMPRIQGVPKKLSSIIIRAIKGNAKNNAN